MLAACKWVDEIRRDRQKEGRSALGVLGMGVEFLARTAGCQGKRGTHMCEGVSGVGGREGGSRWSPSQGLAAARMQWSLLRRGTGRHPL